MRPLALRLAVLLALAAPARAQAPLPEVPDLAYERFTLDNGLTLLVHQDRKAPIVAVNVWYHVGAKDEPDGRTGFAHFFEHIMFQGSENYDRDYTSAVVPIGATTLNGTTNYDRTNYFQNVPVSALDRVLWLESDRMGHLLGAVDSASVEEQRGVVQNEKRQRTGGPYGRVWEYVHRDTYPEGHPYARTIIGSMEDLGAAEIPDFHEWFRTYYGPNNAVLVVAGDVEPAHVRDRVEHYFGHIPPGPPLAKLGDWTAPLAESTRRTLQDRVPQARIYRVWNVPGWGHPALPALDLAARVLTGGQAARLNQRLVQTERLATSVAAFTQDREIGSHFVVIVEIAPGADPAAVEAVLDQELDRFRAEGPTAQELRAAQTLTLADAVRQAEGIGGFGGTSDLLATAEVFGGSADRYRDALDAVRQATPAGVRDAVRTWAPETAYTLTVVPFEEWTAGEPLADRSALPDVPAPPDAAFPAVQETRLSNGLRVLLARRTGAPLVAMRLVVDAGYVTDPDGLDGAAQILAGVVNGGGAGSLDAAARSARLDALGARLWASAGIESHLVGLSALRTTLEPSLALFADAVLRPRFDPADVERVRAQTLAQQGREAAIPQFLAFRLLPLVAFPEGHPYRRPYTGTGYASTVPRIAPDDLEALHDTWFRPNNATLVVAGDLALDALVPLLEGAFGDWAPADVPEIEVSPAAPPSDPVVYLVDRPGLPQATVIGASLVGPRAADQEALDVMDAALGGSSTARINLNLRESKGWTYGAYTQWLAPRAQRVYAVQAPVQADKTAETLTELMREFSDVRGPRPLALDEIGPARDRELYTLAGRWEGIEAIAGSLGSLAVDGLPLDHYAGLPARVRAVTPEAVAQAVDTYVHPDRMVWVVIGDRAVVEDDVRALGLPVEVLDLSALQPE